MEKNSIINKAKEMKSVDDLSALLNTIGQDELGKNFHNISAKQLRYFGNSNLFSNRYKTFYIPKKSGGKREIDAPCHQLSIILYLLNIILKSIYVPCTSVMGFAEGRSVVQNAQMHVGHHYVFNIDLENFFPSIPQARVWKRIQLPPFNFSQEIANVIAGLCCHTNVESGKNVLPQGAPTSPLLTNAICDNLDRKMRGVSNRFGLHYSRYADDMTFSSMHNIYQEGDDFQREIQRIIESQGFKLNEKKTRLLRDGRRQEVTGLTVNKTVNVTRKYIRDIRCILHLWETEGYAKTYSKFYTYYKHDKGYVKKGEPIMENVIEGKLNYLQMVKGANNAAYKKLHERFIKLHQFVFDSNKQENNKNTLYVLPYKIKDFETGFSTKIKFKEVESNKIIGKCTIDGKEVSIFVSKSTQDALRQELQTQNLSIETSDGTTSDILAHSTISLCQQVGRNFWLLTKFAPQRSAYLSVQDSKIDIDKLLDLWEEKGFDCAVRAFVETSNAFVTPQEQPAIYTNMINVSKLSLEPSKSTSNADTVIADNCIENKVKDASADSEPKKTDKPTAIEDGEFDLSDIPTPEEIKKWLNSSDCKVVKTF